ncbi:MAG: response regulator [Ignavibacteriaceae bacterium]
MEIVIIENNKHYREGLKTILNQIDDFNVVFDCCNFMDFINFIKKEPADIILLDYDMAESELCKISEIIPNIRIIIISNYSEICYFEKLINMGITDIILKNSIKTEFEKKIRSAFNDGKSII